MLLFVFATSTTRWPKSSCELARSKPRASASAPGCFVTDVQQFEDPPIGDDVKLEVQTPTPDPSPRLEAGLWVPSSSRDVAACGPVGGTRRPFPPQPLEHLAVHAPLLGECRPGQRYPHRSPADSSDRAWIITAVQMGLRPGEVSGLTWEVVDFNAGRVVIHKSLGWVNGKPY